MLLPLTISRYLIVNYESSNFSVSQNVWAENAPSEILAIRTANSTAPPAPKSTKKSGISTGGIIGVIAAIAVLAIIAAVTAIFIIRRKRKRRKEEEAKKVDEDDPYRKAEMDGNGKPPVGELYTEGKFGEVDSSSKVEMQGSQPTVPHDDKNRAEIEGSKGGVEMEGTKGGVEMEGGRLRAEMDGDHLAPVEMYAGPHGLYEMPSPITSNSDLPSPMSSSNERSSRSPVGWSHRNKPVPGLPVSGSSDDIEYGAKGNGSELWNGRRPRGQRQSSRSNEVSSPSTGTGELASYSPRSTRLNVPSRTNSPMHIASQSSPARDQQQQKWRKESTSSRNNLTNLSTSSDEAGSGSSNGEQWNRRFDSRDRILPSNTPPDMSPVKSKDRGPSAGRKDVNDRRPSPLGAVARQAALSGDPANEPRRRERALPPGDFF